MPTRMTEPEQDQHTRARLLAVIAAFDIAERRDQQDEMFDAFGDLPLVTDLRSESSLRGFRLGLANLAWAITASILKKSEGDEGTVRFWTQVSAELPGVARNDIESEAVRAVVNATTECTSAADFLRAMDYGTGNPPSLQSVMRACVALLRVGVPLHGDDPMYRWHYVTRMTKSALGLD